jgi:hypothetical protein
MSHGHQHSNQHSEPSGVANGSPALRRIGEALQGLRYGSVLAIVQDGVIVQIERTEKTRLDKTDR